MLLLLAAGPAWAEAPVASFVPPERPAAVEREDFATWRAGFRARALAEGISPATFDRALDGVTPDPEVIRRDRSQNEFTKTLWAYLTTAVSDARLANGRRAFARHADMLARVERETGVDAAIVTAIWGLESAYGAVRGSDNTIRSLATLAHDVRRRDFFEDQLLAALRILDDGGPALRGSWAGAMGHTQFMPRAYLDHAVDGDGDGDADIWSDDPDDALMSTGAYLAHHGWTPGQLWGVEVTLPDGFDYLLTGEPTTKTAAEWEALGVRGVDGPLPPGEGVSIRVPGGAGHAALATYPNFRVLERYNTADAYVIAVGHLADRIRGAGPFRGGWPDDRALTFDERVELQARLRDAGFDPQKLDGRVGPLTLEATRRWQASAGLVPDGYPSPALLERLRAATGG
ncbi:lytic murein transglycosylase [Jannaschia sp. Os4]|uniref:lytic murein transglycosylase n=1 Tax=Jannaschia sp. Os4 TaxID=2807617 RepID=UPI0031B6166F